MRIAVDATALYGRYGGVEYALWNLLFALHRVDVHNEYCLYIPRDGPPPELLERFAAHWRWVRLPFRGAEKLGRIAWQQAVLPFQLRADDCDLLHAPTYILPLLNSILPGGVPVVLTVYDLIALEHPHFATPLNRLHYRALLPCSLNLAERIIAPSDAVKKSVVARVPKSAGKTRVVPLGLEPIFFQTPSAAAREEVRARYALPEQFILFVGNFEPKKNLDDVLKALELLPDAPPLVVAGGARAWRELPSTPRLQTIGYVTRRDLPALYSMCSAFVFPSLAEGFGLPVLEALACGAPVVTSTLVPLPNLEKVALLCDPHDCHALAGALKRVLQEKDLQVHLRAAGKEYAQPFTWKRAALQTLEIYSELTP
jgi:glycosyltransferase involved in cell wall biosynthesis